MDKKEREMAVLEKFKECFSDFPEGQITPSESPDFLVRNPSKVFGIEVTLLHHELTKGRSPLQEQESLRGQILQKAKDSYYKQDNPPIRIGVHFNTNYRLRKKDVSPLAEDIIHLILDSMPLVDGACIIEEDENNWETFPQELWFIHLSRNKATKKNIWSPVSSGAIPNLQAEQIQTIINKKNTRLATYKQSCSEMWLLIVAEGFAISSTFVVPEEISCCCFCSPFDRVFLLQCFDSQVFELTVEDQKMPI